MCPSSGHVLACGCSFSNIVEGVESPTWGLRIKDSCGSHIPSHSYQNDTRRVSDTWANGPSGSVGKLTLQRRLCDTMPSLSGPSSIDP
ncbi:hypothetical protein VNO78_02003 [Psophocarpus tetragonolobus]|uniref:Uncharacterized protein n=1 Tax=Psophocarpus tetragonolobus TaxID=3891 RepID=A0AAN9XUJ5_PSOTE